MRRRNFLRNLGLGWLGSWLPSGIAVWLAGCASSAKSEFQNVGSIAQLDDKGFLLLEYFTADPLLVVRRSKAKDTLAAVNPTCPHQGCLVNWKADKGAFVCPCHGSTFNPDGQVLQGPAQKALVSYKAEIRGKEVWVSTQ